MEIILVGSLAVLLWFFLVIFFWSKCVKVGGPNEVLIISGRPNVLIDSQGNRLEIGFRMVKGGRTFVWPVIEKVDVLSLEMICVEMEIPPFELKDQEKICVSATLQVKIDGTDAGIITAAENFLSKSPSMIQEMARKVVEGHLKLIFSNHSYTDIRAGSKSIIDQVLENAQPDLKKMGLQIVTLTLQQVKPAP